MTHPLDERASVRQLLAIALCGLVVMLDGYDGLSVGLVVPLMAKAWGAPAHAFGLALALGLAGAFAGVVVGGAAADRFGRRPVLLLAVAAFAVGTLATAFTTSLAALAVCRLATGVGLGAAMPAVLALVSELAPARLRSTLVTAVVCGIPIGGALGAFASAPMIAAWGWRAVFWAGGIAPALLAPALAAAVAEPPRRAPAAPRRRLAYAALFRDGRALGVSMFALVNFLVLMSMNLLTSWVPTLAAKSGHSPAQSVLAVAAMNASGLAGGLTIGRLNDLRNPYLVMTSAFLAGGAGAFVIGLGGGAGAGIFLFGGAVGFLFMGAQISFASVVATYLPVEMRATGLGLIMAVGRLGAIAGPLIGAAAIDGPHAFSALSLVVALACVASAMAIFAADPRRARTRAAHPA